MKLSKIIETKGLTSVTLHVIDPTLIACELFIKGNTKAKAKVYTSLNVDVDIPKISNDNVKHLGIKEYYHLVEDDYYVNLYYY